MDRFLDNCLHLPDRGAVVVIKAHDSDGTPVLLFRVRIAADHETLTATWREGDNIGHLLLALGAAIDRVELGHFGTDSRQVGGSIGRPDSGGTDAQHIRGGVDGDQT